MSKTERKTAEKTGKQLRAERAKQAAEAQKKRTRKITLIVLSVILAVSVLISVIAVAANLIMENYLDTGKKYRNAIAYKTEHWTVNGAMMSFYLYDRINNYYLDYFGMSDVEEMQQSTLDNSGNSYFDLVGELVSSEFYSKIVLAEAATANGMTLSEKEQSFVENRIKAIELGAEKQKMSLKDYLFTNYGRGITLEDARQALTLLAVADRYQAELYTGYTPTTAEIVEKATEFSEALRYYRTDYYMVDFEVRKRPGESGYQEEHDRVYELVEQLAHCNTLENFLSEARELLAEENGVDVNSDPDDFDLEYALSRCLFTDQIVNQDPDNEISVWACDAQRKVGDTFISDGKISLAACFMVRPFYSVDNAIPAVRVIALKTENYVKASDALAEFSAIQEEFGAGDGSEASFMALVSKYSHDPLRIATDGLMEDTYTTTGAPMSADVQLNKLMKSWLSTAKKGDTSSFTAEDTLYFVYACGEGKDRSYIDGEATLKALNEKALETLCQKTYPLTVNKKYIAFFAPLAKED